MARTLFRPLQIEDKFLRNDGNDTTTGTITMAGAVIGSLSGVLKASGGTVAGSATLDDIADGSTYVRSENNLSSALKTNYDAAYTHSTGSGSDHADVASNTTHRTSNGSDHSYINQDVTTTANPTFAITTLSALVLNGDIVTENAAIDVDLKDNDASAISFDTTGKAGILEISTVNDAEGVKMSGNLTVEGDLVVNGTTTTINTENLLVEDKLVTINDGGLAESGGGAGLEIEEDSTITGWIKTLANRTGWSIKAPASDFSVILKNSSIDDGSGGDYEVDLSGGSLFVKGLSQIDQDVREEASPTFAGLTLTSDISMTSALDVDLLDNNASALSFDTTGKAGILEIVTTNDAEGIKMSGTLSMGLGTSINEFSTDGTLAGDSDDAVPTEKAVKAYVDNISVGYAVKTVEILSSGITAGDDYTIPGSNTYYGDLPADSSDKEHSKYMDVYLNGQKQYQGGDGFSRDYLEASNGTGKTTIKFSSDLVIGDVVECVIKRV